MEDDFELIELPTYEEFKATLTRALNNNPLNWTRRSGRKRQHEHGSVETNSGTGSSLNSQSQSGTSSDNSPAGTSNLNPQTSSIFHRRQMLKKGRGHP